jgi:hypothetical protein
MGIMKAPSGMRHTHLKILTTLAREGACTYLQFRADYNPWRRESYFDGQMQWLKKRGLIVFTSARTIRITDNGLELVHSSEKHRQ